MIHYPNRILIVEDNKADVRMLKDVLESQGYETLQTGGGLEALAAAFRYLLMSRAERYLGHAIDRSDFERRLRVVRRRI